MAKLSRRSLIAVAGVGATAALAPVAARARPFDPTEAWVRLKAASDGAVRYDGFDGMLLAATAQGIVRPLCGLRTLRKTRLTGQGQAAFEEEGHYYDLETGKPLTAMTNPLTGDAVTVPAFAERGVVTPGVPLWRRDDARLILEEASPEDMTTTIAAVDDIQDGAATMVRTVGTRMRITPWLPWLRMERAPGNCVIRCSFTGGFDRPELLPGAIAALDQHAT